MEQNYVTVILCIATDVVRSVVCVCVSPCVWHTGLPWRLEVNPHTHPIPTERPVGIPHKIHIPIEPRNPPYPYSTPRVFSLDAF